MSEAITYTFVAVGQETVARAFEGIDAAATRSAAKTESAYKRVGAGAGKAADESAKATKRAEDQRWREVERTAARIEKEFQREAKAAEKAAKRKETAEARVAAKRREGDLSAAKAGVAIALGTAVAISAAISKPVSESMHAQSLANRISIRGRTPGGEAVDPTMLRRELEAQAIAHAGQTTEGVAGGVSAYQERRGGDPAKALEEARKFSDVFATFASATGEETSKFGELGATLAKKFDVKTVEDMGNAMALVVAHARQAGIPLDEAVQHFDKLASSAKRFGIGGGAQGVTQLGALTSIAAQGVGAAGADQAVERLLTRLTTDKVARGLKGHGVDVFKTDKSGQTNPIRDVLAQIFSKVGPADNMAEKRVAVEKSVGGAKQFAAIEPLFKAYADAYGAATGSAAEKTTAATEAMEAAFDQAAAASGSYAETQKDAAQAENDASAQLEAAWQKLVGAVGEELAPQIAELAKEISSSPEVFQMMISAVKLLAQMFGGLAYTLQKWGIIHENHNAKADKYDRQAREQQKIIDSLGSIANPTEEQDRKLGLAIGYRNVYRDAAQKEREKGQAAGELTAEDAMGTPGAGAPPAHGKAPPPPAASGLPDYATDPTATGRFSVPTSGAGAGDGGQRGAAAQEQAAKVLTDAAGALKDAAADLKRAKGSVFGHTATGGTG